MILERLSVVYALVAMTGGVVFVFFAQLLLSKIESWPRKLGLSEKKTLMGLTFVFGLVSMLSLLLLSWRNDLYFLVIVSPLILYSVGALVLKRVRGKESFPRYKELQDSISRDWCLIVRGWRDWRKWPTREQVYWITAQMCLVGMLLCCLIILLSRVRHF